jgi:hypothetical protein
MCPNILPTLVMSKTAFSFDAATFKQEVMREIFVAVAFAPNRLFSFYCRPVSFLACFLSLLFYGCDTLVPKSRQILVGFKVELDRTILSR